MVNENRSLLLAYVIDGQGQSWLLGDFFHTVIQGPRILGLLGMLGPPPQHREEHGNNNVERITHGKNPPSSHSLSVSCARHRVETPHSIPTIILCEEAGASLHTILVNPEPDF